MLNVFSWIGIVPMLGLTLYAALGWAGKIRYHRDFEKGSWQNKKLARAHATMYFGVALTLTFPLHNNQTLWLTLVALGVLLAITGIVMSAMWNRSIRKNMASEPFESERKEL